MERSVHFSGTTIVMVLFYLCMVISAMTIRKYRDSIIQIKPFYKNTKMMNILERKQIQKYLEDKRLPLDIYLEIEDHIISQVEELEKKE